MRISDNVMYNAAINNLQKNLDKLLELQSQASSGKRINQPSDDPAGTMKVVDYNTSISKVGQYQRNINNASAFLTATESAISNTHDIISRAKELSVSALNGTSTADERSIMAKEVDQLYQQVLQEANTQVNGRYLFSGYNSNTPPYDSNGIYTGTAYPGGDINIEIEPGATVTMNMPGYRVFGTSSMGVDILGSLNNLKSALENNNLEGISTAATALDSSMNQLDNVRAEVGARMNRLQTTKGFLDKLNVDLTGYKSEAEDADITKVITDLTRQQNILETSKASVSNVLQQSILNFLK